MRVASLVSRALPFSPQKNLVLPFRPDEVYRVPTDDGSAIALGRYRPRGERRVEEPVILCHGLGANRFNLDYDERYSLARYLARRGYEAWVLELRGRGLAGPPVDATFDEQAQHDVRAAMRAALSASSARRVFWVGHSKGGLLAFAHMGRNPDAPLAGVVALGSPVTFEFQPGLRRFIRSVAPLLSRKTLPTGSIAALSAYGLKSSVLVKYLVLEENMEPELLRLAGAHIAADVPGGVGRAFARWISSGRWDGEDGFDYRQHLDAVRVPVLLVAGNRDLLAPPDAVLRAANHLGGPVESVVLSRLNGYLADYGHGDLALGRRAPEEVFPIVERFLGRLGTRP